MSISACADDLTTTLTIHWSSIDGVDLMEPIVIDKVNPNMTVKEAIEASGRSINEDMFTNSGYMDLHMILPSPMSEYNDIINLMSATFTTKNAKVGENGLDVYAVLYKLITEDINAVVDNPICGTTTTTNKNDENQWDYATQTNRPVAHIPENAHYNLDGYNEIENPGAIWTSQDKCSTPFEPYIGTLEGGNSYYATVLITPDYGYLFPESGSVFTINGETPIDSFGARGVACAIATIKAEHVVVNDAAVPATFKAAGKTAGSHCSACGEIITAQKTIAKLGAAKLSKVTKGRKKFTAKWKAVKNVDGYQIQYSRYKRFKKAKKKTVKGTKKTKATIKKLKTKKTYYVRIRAYKVINGKVVYSKWSAKKKVKVK